MDRDAVVTWVETHVSPAGPIELAHERPWSTVMRVPLAEGTAWFKACSSVQAFEPRLTAELFDRWPELLPEVLGCDERRNWLLLADAGTRIGDLGNRPEYWLEVLPSYAELQRGEAEQVPSHLAHGVPDLRLATLPERFGELADEDLPFAPDQRDALHRFAPRFDRLCAELSSEAVPDTVQHDDLHMHNVYLDRDLDRLRILDWGDSSISHPFASLVSTFRFLEERNGLAPEDPWFARLRDAYLEPWGSGLTWLFDVAISVGLFANVLAALRQRPALSGVAQNEFDRDLGVRLHRALALAQG